MLEYFVGFLCGFCAVSLVVVVQVVASLIGGEE